MSYLSRNRRPTRFSRPGKAPGSQPNYAARQTGVRRHEYTTQEKNTAALAAGDYIAINMLKFKRTFDPLVEDVEPTPTRGNNYQDYQVMNGSRINRFRKKITIRNNIPTDAANTVQKTIKFDIYEVALSFWDGYILEQYEQEAGLFNEIINHDSSFANPTFGEVSFDSVHPTVYNNHIRNSTFLQRYYRHKGQVSIDAGGQAEINVNYIPPQCRRSNSGMFWGLILLNDPDTNFNEAISGTVVSETSFEEIPSSERNGKLY